MLSCFPTECYIGHYGYNCNETCGHCMDLSQCSTVSGICHTGCSDGYMGSLCKKGAFILKRFLFKRNSETKSMVANFNHVYITALLHKTYGNV